MNKHLLRAVALVMVFATLLCIPVTAMASEPENTIPENATRHTIEITVEPGEEVNDEFGVMPLMWDQESHSLNPGTVTYTSQFTVDGRYFAYEMSATATDGSAASGSYGVQLLYHVTAGLNGMSGTPNGTTYKKDWIDLGDIRDSLLFSIHNNSTVPLTVHITYYSWNS